MLEFHLKNLRRLLELRNKAISDRNFETACYYDTALSGCIYYLLELYIPVE